MKKQKKTNKKKQTKQNKTKERRKKRKKEKEKEKLWKKLLLPLRNVAKNKKKDIFYTTIQKLCRFGALS